MNNNGRSKKEAENMTPLTWLWLARIAAEKVEPGIVVGLVIEASQTFRMDDFESNLEQAINKATDVSVRHCLKSARAECVKAGYIARAVAA